MNEPIDVQKTLTAYGAELDELRVWCRKQEERLARLENEIRFLTRNLTDETRPQLTRNWQRLDELEERLAALEARPAPVPGYAPGWVVDTGSGIYCGPSDHEGYAPDISFYYNRGQSFVTLRGWIPNQDAYRVDLTADQLRRLIGAAMAILKRMEMGGES